MPKFKRLNQFRRVSHLSLWGSLAALAIPGCGGSADSGDEPIQASGGVAGTGAGQGGTSFGHGGSGPGAGGTGQGNSSAGGAAGASGGSAGVGGGQSHLDCTATPESAVGSVAEQTVDVASAESWTTSSANWSVDGYISGFEASVWTGPELQYNQGYAHLTSVDNGDQICVANVRRNALYGDYDTRGSSISLSGFSNLGSCQAATGSSFTLHFCDLRASYTGTPPEGCLKHDLRIWGEVDGALIDETRTARHSEGGGTTCPTEFLDAYFSGGGRLHFGEFMRTDFLRMQLQGATHVYCIQSVTDDAPDDDDAQLLTLQVIELGSCPGNALGGEVEACF